MHEQANVITLSLTRFITLSLTLFPCQEAEIWLRIKGRIQSGQSYEWDFESGSNEESRDGIPAIIPMFWADGEQFGAEVTISEPDQPGDGRIQRMLLPHGVVTVDSFLHQTGAAWVVLVPGSLGNAFAIRRFSFREVESEPDSDLSSKMPIPVRYVPIKSVLEDKIARALDLGAEALKSMPIVVITTEGAKEDRDRALALGADEYLTKPIQSNRVLAIAKALLKVE